jgi:hypothetical protein
MSGSYFRKEGSSSFLKKTTKKLLSLGRSETCPFSSAAASNRQKFLVSFFQKRKALPVFQGGREP